MNAEDAKPTPMPKTEIKPSPRPKLSKPDRLIPDP